MAGNDRKLQMALEQALQDQLGSPSADRLATSPFGPLTDRLSRQTLIYLITTLNCAFPYYDFSYVSSLEARFLRILSFSKFLPHQISLFFGARRKLGKHKRSKLPHSASFVSTFPYLERPSNLPSLLQGHQPHFRTLNLSWSHY